MSPPTVRFAPSPTGHLHLGNARVAVVNWLFARRHERAVPAAHRRYRPRAVGGRVRGRDPRGPELAGLGWDAEFRQSSRAAEYEAAFERLRAAGRVYPCYETPEELAATRKLQQARGEPPRYDRRALRLGAAERAALEAQGRRPHWRLLLANGELAFDDLVMGPRRFVAEDLGDPVLRREDGSATYLFASAVDDAELGISHVIRGEDHVSNTALQLAILQALAAPAPHSRICR